MAPRHHVGIFSCRVACEDDGAATGDLVKGFEMKEEKAMLMDVVRLAFKN